MKSNVAGFSVSRSCCRQSPRRLLNVSKLNKVLNKRTSLLKVYSVKVNWFINCPTNYRAFDSRLTPGRLLSHRLRKTRAMLDCRVIVCCMNKWLVAVHFTYSTYVHIWSILLNLSNTEAATTVRENSILYLLKVNIKWVRFWWLKL